jgi:hypothetical protein
MPAAHNEPDGVVIPDDESEGSSGDEAVFVTVALDGSLVPSTVPSYAALRESKVDEVRPSFATLAAVRSSLPSQSNYAACAPDEKRTALRPLLVAKQCS